MFEKITVFDIETPDRLNSRICSIGLTRIENGEIVGSENFLIDPECDFCKMNIGKHHIHPEDVEGKPKFPEFWTNYGAYFFDGIVAGHGVSFDLNVLKKTLEAYQIEIQPIRYVDTLKIAKDNYTDLPNHKLSTICESMGISLQNHDSGSDSHATAEIMLDILGRCSETELSRYVNLFDPNQKTEEDEYRQHWSTNLSAETKALRALKVVVESMGIDGAIDYEDFVFLLGYIEKHCYGLVGRYPFDEIITIINRILEDGDVTQEELSEFTQFCKKAFAPVESSEDQFDGNVVGKHIVLTGDFAIAPRSKVEKKLTELGAIVHSSVTLETEMVIVGKLGSKAWGMGTYGKKVERAKQLQSQGKNILILKEEDVFES